MESKNTKNPDIKGKKKVKSINNNKAASKTKKEDTKLKEENLALQEKVLRVTAEMQNMRRHYEDEINNIYKYEGEDLILKLLPIVDNFERAIKLDDNDLTDELSKFLSGFKMIYTNLVGILNKLDVKPIDAQGLEFDPSTMEAVLTEHDEKLPANVVIEVLQKGYTYKDKVIRHAMVKVNE